jgi:hypothetical protein
MGFNLRDLPAYIGMLAVIGFFAYVSIQSWREDKKGKDKDQKK